MLLLLLLAAIAGSGCSLLRRSALNQVANAVAGSGTTFASEEDPELAKAAAPFSLKLMESLLAENPQHQGLLTAAASGFTQYAFAFVQQEADELEARDLKAAEAVRARARRLYLRAHTYGLRGLEVEHRLEEKGFMVLFWADTGWVRFFSKHPVIRPDDLRKSKLFVGAGNAAQVDSYRSIGFHPVPLETVDVLPSLQTGLINAVPLPPSIALAGQVDAVAPHMLDLAWAPLVGAAVMTKKTWDTIPVEGRDAVRTVAAETGALLKADGRRESAESVEAMRKRGLTVHAVTPDVEAEWRREVEAAYPKIRGVIVPVDIFDEVVAELKTLRAARDGGKK